IAIAILSACGFQCIWLGDILGVLTLWFNSFIAFLAQFSPQKLMQLSLSSTEFWIMLAAIILVSMYVFKRKIIYLQSGIVAFISLFILFIIQDYKAINSHKLIVYNTNGISSADLYLGKKCYPIYYNTD